MKASAPRQPISGLLLAVSSDRGIRPLVRWTERSREALVIESGRCVPMPEATSSATASFPNMWPSLIRVYEPHDPGSGNQSGELTLSVHQRSILGNFVQPRPDFIVRKKLEEHPKSTKDGQCSTSGQKTSSGSCYIRARQYHE